MDNILEQGKHKDLPELGQLYEELIDYLGNGVNYPGWIKGVYPVSQTASEGINEKSLYLIRRNGRIAATVILRHRPEAAYEQADWQMKESYDNILVIYTFAVHPDFLHQGVGEQLLKLVIEEAVKIGMKSIRLDVYEKNLPAVRLYEKCGFKYIDTVDLGLGEYGLDRFKLYEKVLI